MDSPWERRLRSSSAAVTAAVVAARSCRQRVWTDLTETVQRSNYRVVKDYEKCTNCGECVRRCQVFAHTFDSDRSDGKPVYHRDKCVGCGACGMGCPSGALHLEPVSEEEWFHVPSSFTEWEEKAPGVSGSAEVARWPSGPR